jgi:glutamate synthase (NADPH/NADH) small chain
MPDPTGFLHPDRALPTRRPVDVRIQDWKEVYEDFAPEASRTQAARCMDCGIPFCHNGCPLGNLIPEWNDLVRTDDWREAIERLHATNNFPEFTGRLCPAPCEAACVLGIGDSASGPKAVAIKQIEVEIIDRAFAEGWVRPQAPAQRTGKRIAVVGSGPTGLAAAQQLTRAGHEVTVLERADRVGGLLRYGIPEFKMEKRVLERRLDQMRAEGTRFCTGVDVGADVTVPQLREQYDAVLLAGGSTLGRDLPVEGRDLAGIHLAMDYLVPANRVQEGDAEVSPITAEGKDVVIIGGGDTGADCLGTAHRQGARSVTQLEIMPRPPQARADATPWPTWPLMYRTSSAHEEGGERLFAVNTQRFAGQDGSVTRLELVDVEMVDGRPTPLPGTERTLPAQLVLLAMGFTGPQRTGLLEALGVELDGRGNVARDSGWATSVPGVFVAGDMGRGQSLVVWAIAEGRAAAAAVDVALCGSTQLPAPVTPTSR